MNIKSIKQYIVAHKIISTVVALVVVVGGYWYISSRGSTQETRYVLAAATKGTIVSSVTGTGQIATSDQVDVKSKVSGNVIKVAVINGQQVKAGDLLAEIDPSDAYIALESAQLAYDKLTAPATQVNTIQTQNSLNDAQESKLRAVDSLAADYANSLNTVAATFVDMPTIMSGLRDAFYSSSGYLNNANSVAWSDQIRTSRDQAGAEFDASYALYDKNLASYKLVTSSIATSSTEALLNQTYNTALALANVIKDTKSTLDKLQSLSSVNTSMPAAFTTLQNNLSTWSSEINNHVSSLVSLKTGIANDKIAITSADRSISLNQASLTELQSGADPLDVESERLNLLTKQKAYGDYFIKAPFDGIVAKVAVKVGTDGSNATIATLISQQQIANISLNEVDVSKIKLGNRVTMTFDAIDGLTITGKVTDIDLVGTVTQGVVTYNVQITLDTADDRVKSGMSVSATISTDVHQDVITIPSSAIKTQGTTSYVQVVPTNEVPSTTDTSQGIALSTVPESQAVEIGLSDDTNTEITSGLTEGDQVVVRTVTVAKTATTASAPSLFGAVGGRTTGGTAGTRATTR